jgi:hypothetical protein
VNRSLQSIWTTVPIDRRLRQNVVEPPNRTTEDNPSRSLSSTCGCYATTDHIHLRSFNTVCVPRRFEFIKRTSPTMKDLATSSPPTKVTAIPASSTVPSRLARYTCAYHRYMQPGYYNLQTLYELKSDDGASALKRNHSGLWRQRSLHELSDSPNPESYHLMARLRLGHFHIL